MTRSFDLNLLPVLVKIYEHGSVSAAAAHLGMSQSAVSGVLAKLRELYGDPLFHRVGHGMRPTARMNALISPLRESLQRVDGTLVRELARTAIADVTPPGWTAPEEFVAKAADGVTNLHGLLYKPYDFDPGRRYPVVETIYAGVGEQAIPHIFADAVPDSLLLQGGEPLNDALRRAGFVVFAVDGRGTPGRSKAFEDVVYGRLGQHEIPDHVAALRAVAAARPYIDMDRVGIAGPSYGGFFAIRALLQAPDVYKVAVARAPGGNRLDGPQGGTEPYMGTPGPGNAGAYVAASNEHLIDTMRGKLMLILGTSDMNTPFYNIRYVESLAAADKQYRLIILPQAGHSTGKNPYVLSNTLDFLVENLMLE